MDTLQRYRDALEDSGFDAATVQAAGVGCGYCPRCLLSGITTPISTRRPAAGGLHFHCVRCDYALTGGSGPWD